MSLAPYEYDSVLSECFRTILITTFCIMFSLFASKIQNKLNISYFVPIQSVRCYNFTILSLMKTMLHVDCYCCCCWLFFFLFRLLFLIHFFIHIIFSYYAGRMQQSNRSQTRMRYEMICVCRYIRTICMA